MTSMVLYVAIFFAFSAFAVAVSTNYNYKTLGEKGNIWVNEQANKFQMNLLASGRESIDVSNIGGKIVFSNDDEYRYDSSKKKIYKNDGLCISDVEDFKIITENDDFVNYNVPKKDNNMSAVKIEFKVKKYGVEKTFQMYITAGDEFNE